ncbi:cobalamin/Fe(3+)-siderophore ABC transporter ATP-binding protein [Tumebacillus algifaecis]|uniref:Cobalamin/Fe(3+)-siderophore ABC transporter ATP-binding protein n=1 Tax=Tumebacillus algifaecis TaxID=1214604 RepID=A0A223D539_9BACL|nr:ABC transporter ATP-binding protein [Tumebacillus algifaecis]ASS76464.1 cobalamin/Fe(3+)-siderophore ABC transporter ATP-binding protein [Tumebacillus algifaecis]
MEALETKNLSLSYGEATIIDSLNLSIPKGKVTVFIGSNGCGKSTLLRSLARLLKPVSGAVLLDGEAVAKLPTKEVAKRLAILPQGPVAPEGLTVLQLVKQGRYPYQNWLQQWSEADEKMVRDALLATGMAPFAEKAVDSLSGGQRQRAWIAMTLAQGTSTILLDEPTTYLDLTHQIEVLDILFDLNRTEQRTIVMVLHDLNLACRYADHIVALSNQKVYAQGKPEEIITTDLVKDVFHMDCQIIADPVFGTPMLVPFGKGRQVKREEAVALAIG